MHRTRKIWKTQPTLAPFFSLLAKIFLVWFDIEIWIFDHKYRFLLWCFILWPSVPKTKWVLNEINGKNAVQCVMANQKKKITYNKHIPYHFIQSFHSIKAYNAHKKKTKSSIWMHTQHTHELYTHERRKKTTQQCCMYPRGSRRSCIQPAVFILFQKWTSKRMKKKKNKITLIQNAPKSV